ncbi:MAG: MATE family efflux transporter [Gemmatimonadetes bacterium]|nr:MATE family efflux transporter [Gemmatimonadota bacterium]
MLPLAQLRPTGEELREMVRLAWPIVLAQVGVMLLGVVDTAMVGRVGSDAVAAVALGHLYWMNVSVPGMGLLLVLDPVVSQAVGARDARGVARGVQRGVLLAVLVSIPAAIALLPGELFFAALRQPAEITPVAAAYARWTALGMLPFFLFVSLRQSLQAMAHTRAIVISIIVGNALNVVLNWALIYGHLGAPPLGAVGSAISTVIGRWAMFGMLLWFGRAQLWPTLFPWAPESWSLRPLWRMIVVGLPVAFQQWLEVGVFAAGAVAIGWIGVAPLAAHEIAINLAALTFMVPLGVSAAAAAMVGRAIGRGDIAAARRDSVAAIGVGLGFMLVSAVVFLAVPGTLAAIFLEDPETRAIAASLIAIAGVFQVFDGIQAVCAGILRGTADTRIPMLIHLGGFWGIGAPLGLVLAFPGGMGPRGIWYGYLGSLAAVAIAQLMRVRWRLARDVGRLQIDEASELASIE